MPEESRSPSTFRFGPFELSLETEELRRNGIRLKLFGQPIKVLILLVETPRQLVTREKLQKALWPADTYTDFERGLNAAVSRLREMLGDSADDPQYIETVPRRGYRFIGSDKVMLEGNKSAIDSVIPFVLPKPNATHPDQSLLAQGTNDALTGTATDRGAMLPARPEMPRYDTVPPLPQNFVPRPAELEALRQAILNDHDGRHVALVGLRGMGGIGKDGTGTGPLSRPRHPDRLSGWDHLGQDRRTAHRCRLGQSDVRGGASSRFVSRRLRHTSPQFQPIAKPPQTQKGALGSRRRLGANVYLSLPTVR
jgi:DNA-binding winged helix-turn-helix (wHTH) protein